MTSEPPRPAPPAPEVVAQALALVLKAMDDSGPTSDGDGEDIESNMTQLARLAWRRHVAAEAFQRAAQTEAALFCRRRNALLPIHRLPQELFSAILIKSVNEKRIHRTRALQPLAQVAWQWWQTIKSDGRFWMHITPPMGSLELQIRKAGNLPLRLYWPASSTWGDAVTNLLRQQAERWTSIDVESYRDDVALKVLCTSRFPRLQYLKVHPVSWGTSGVQTFNLAAFQNLQEAHLPIVPSFSVSPTSNSPLLLQTLHLDLHSRNPSSAYDLESLLRYTPQLIELGVRNLDDRTSPPAPVDTTIVNLPMLRRLQFSDVVSATDRDRIPLVAKIRAPLLEKLGLHYPGQPGARANDIGGRTMFDALVTRSRALLSRSEDAPLYSTLRNACPSASWTVGVLGRDVSITAEGSGRGQLDIYCTTKDYVPEYILQPLAEFTLPIDFNMTCSHDGTDLAFWDDVLDATPLLLRSFTLKCRDPIARQVMNRLSTKAPSLSPTNPRAPLLEKLRFQEQFYDQHSWSKGGLRDAVKTMLKKRWKLFIQGGVFDPPKLTVTGPHGLVFDEDEGRWLDSNDAQSQP